MCTTGRLVQADRASDWVGMQHDGPVKTVSFKLEPNQPAYLDVRIDPAAHGEAGLGPIERGVAIKTAANQTLEFRLTAQVVK